MEERQNDAADASLVGSGFAAERLYSELREHVNHAPAHESLLSERKLAERQGLSVGTVRKALARLVDEGLVYKVHGRGNFVARHALAKRILYADTWGASSHPFYLRSLGAMAAEAERHDCRLEILPYKDPHDFGSGGSLRRKVVDPTVLAVIVPWLQRIHYDSMRRLHPGLIIVSATQELRLPGTASVIPDWFSGGFLSAEFLYDRTGSRNMICVYSDIRFSCAMSKYLSDRKPASVKTVGVGWNPDAKTLAEKILAHPFDGIAFQGDRVARDVLRELVKREPGILKRVPTISMSNVGECILPPETARLEVDGTKIGTTLISVIRAMDEGRFFGANIHFQPVPVLPGDQSP